MNAPAPLTALAFAELDQALTTRAANRERWVQTPVAGHTLNDVQSDIGAVHNTMQFDRPERTVLEAPFRPFPRNLLSLSFTLLPRPPWFITNHKGAILGRSLVAFQHRPGFQKLPHIFFNALRG